MRKLPIIALALIFIVFTSTACHDVTQDIDDAEWVLTQHLGGNQGNLIGMFYSLENQKTGSLILIDGGYSENAGRIREIIGDRHVTAWILTHYHNDHIAAFNALWPEMKDRIDVVYVTPLDWETFEATAGPGDDWGTFRLFLKQTTGDSRIVPVHRDEELDIENLHFRFFNAFDEEVSKRVSNPCNDCSLVFKVTVSGDTDINSILFLGDMSSSVMGTFLLERYGAEALKADYIQAAHHGNWGQPIEFYEQLMPKVLFQDGGQNLFVDSKYDAAELKAWANNHGIRTYSHEGCPHIFILSKDKP